MRLDKYLTSVTDLSRNHAKRMIRCGEVSVDGVVVTDAQRKVLPTSQVQWQARVLRTPEPRYFMLHKPEGYVSARKDREHLTVLELFDEDNIDQLHIVGRLDIDTTGLLLVSDDGQWGHRITSPRNGCGKTYWVETTLPIEPELVEVFARGVKLAGEVRPTRPAMLNIVDDCSARLTISEGRFHQVKRMFAFAGNHVKRLHRERIGELVLDDELAPGEYRPLTQEEVALF